MSQFDCGSWFRVIYLGTLKIAIRFLPRLIVSSKVPTKTFFPFTFTNRQPLPLVIFSPLVAYFPRIVMLVNLPAMF